MGIQPIMSATVMLQVMLQEMIIKLVVLSERQKALSAAVTQLALLREQEALQAGY